MIKSLRIAGFKSWADTGDLPLGKITGLFGTNSSGKTSLLQLLLVLKQTAESPDRSLVLDLGNDRTLVDLGTFRDILHNHDREGKLSWEVSWALAESERALTIPNSVDAERPTAEAKELRFAAKLEANGGQQLVRVRRFAYELANYQFSYGYAESGPFPAVPVPPGAPGYYLEVRGPTQPFGQPPWAPMLPPPVKCYGFPDEIRATYPDAGFFSDLELAFVRLMARIRFLGPLRQYPHRVYTWAGGSREDMGSRGEGWVDALLAARSEGKSSDWGEQTLEAWTAHWLQQLGLIDHFRVEEVAPESRFYQVKVRLADQDNEVLITDVGFGVSQILPVIVLCFYAPRGSIILLEHPEIHLHPWAQAGLADVLIDAVQRRGVQIILESHSEHLLRRLQRRIAEEEIPAEELALYFCRREAGASKAEALRLDPYGFIENWPEGFFGDQMEEISSMNKAALARRKRA